MSHSYMYGLGVDLFLRGMWLCKGAGQFRPALVAMLPGSLICKDSRIAAGLCIPTGAISLCSSSHLYFNSGFDGPGVVCL